MHARAYTHMRQSWLGRAGTMVCGCPCVCAHVLTLPHAHTESQFDQSALGALLLCFVIPGFLAMGWQFVKSWLDLASSVATEAKSVPSASPEMKLVNEGLVNVGDIEYGISFPPEEEPEIEEQMLKGLFNPCGETADIAKTPEEKRAAVAKKDEEEEHFAEVERVAAQKAEKEKILAAKSYALSWAQLPLGFVVKFDKTGRLIVTDAKNYRDVIGKGDEVITCAHMRTRVHTHISQHMRTHTRMRMRTRTRKVCALNGKTPALLGLHSLAALAKFLQTNPQWPLVIVFRRTP